jgi:hypothetical protein
MSFNVIESIKVENNRTHKIREEEGYVTKYFSMKNVQICTFDRLGTRIEIILTELPKNQYCVSIPNFYFAINTQEPQNIAYKLIEREAMGKTDAESVELAIEWLLNNLC